MVEHSEPDAELVLRELERAGFAVRADVASTPEELTARLDADRYDVVLSDYRLPGWTAMDALALLRQRGHDTPLIIVTGTLGDEHAVDCVKQGASDYVIKENLARLPVAVRRVLEERALREARRTSEERYRLLFESTPLPVWVFDLATHRVLAVNEAATQHYGYSREEFVSLRIEDLRPPEDLPALHAHLRNIPEAPHSGGTWRHRKKDGTVITVDINAHGLTWEGRRAQLVVAHDITARQRADDELAERARIAELAAEVGAALTQGTTLQSVLQRCCEALVKHLDAAFARIWTLNEAAHVLELQASAGLYTHIDGGHSRVPVGQYKIGLIAAERRPHLTNAVLGDPRVHDQDWAKREGMVAFAGYPLLVQDRVVGVMAMFARHPFDAFVQQALAAVADGIAVGISRKQAEAALVASERRFRALIENSADAIALFGPDGKIVYDGPTTAAILGYAPGELLGRRAVELIHSDDFARIRPELGAGLRSPDRKVILEARVRHKNGSWRLCEGTFTNLLHDPAVRAVVANYRDVTERRQLELQFRQAQKMEAVGRLAAGVAHDFNNLLTAILGSAELALETLKSGTPERDDLEDVRRAALRAADLTRQLLAFSRQQVLAPRVLDLNTLVVNMEKLLRRLISEDVELRTALAPGLGTVRADPGQIEQVIVNLAVNARDAMPQGGKLTIETRNVDWDDGYAEEHFPAKPGPYVLLTVTDTGTGMDAATKSHIFEPFFTTKERGKGTGLGLATVYGIVKQSGGYVWVYSEPGQGTSFKIYLPRVAEAPEPAKPDAEPASLRGSETVLLVEDDEMVRNLTRRMLETRGHTVLLASHGAEALRLLERHEGYVDLLITDVVMPGMSGRDLAQRVAAQRAGIKVLYLSGYTDDAIVRHGVLEPGVAFLQKPFTAEALARKVREVLGGRR